MKKRAAITWLVAWSAAVMMTGCGDGSGGDAKNHAPKATAQSVTTDEDVAKAITLVGADEDNDTITYAVTVNPAHGTLSGTAPSVTYTPTANYHGPDSFKFKVNDGTVDSAEVVVSITVTSINDAPVATAQSIMTDEDVAKAIVLAGTDVDGDTLTNYTVTVEPTHGALSGSVPNLIYTPVADYNGADSFKFKVNDGMVDSAAVTVSITVDERPLRIRVKTNNSGTSLDDEFKIQLTGYGDGFRVDCDDDGTDEVTGQMGDYYCVYNGVEGNYTIAIRGEYRDLHFNADTDKLLSIEEWGTQKWTTMARLFAWCVNVTLNATDAPNLSQVTDVHGMFAGAHAFEGNLSMWDTSNITDMHEMFYEAIAFNGNLNEWNTSNVTNMDSMFESASNFNGDIGDWNTSKVTTMAGMFKFASVFNGDIGGWDTFKVTTMEKMFLGASQFNQDISQWHTLRLTNTKYMFSEASAFNQNIGNWDMSGVDYMDDMFNNASSFNQNLSEWNTESAQSMNRMFQNATGFRRQDLSGWNVDNVGSHTDFFTGTNGTNIEPTWP